MKTLLPQIQKIYVPSPNKRKNYKTFKKLFLTSKWYSEDIEYNFQLCYPCPKIFRQERWMFVQNFEEFKKNQNFQKLYFYSKCSFGHVDCSFNKQDENFPPNFRQSFCLYCFTFHANISERIQIDTESAISTTREKIL